MSYVLNVIASVGRQNDVYRPIKIQKSYQPTVFFNVIAALSRSWSAPLIAHILMMQLILLVTLFELRLNTPVNNFSVMSGRSHRFLVITSTLVE